MTLPAIDAITYSKAAKHPPGHGYSRRPAGVRPSAIVVHSTSNSRKNTQLSAEAVYLRDSAEVSAHFLIGKRGEIYELLAPRWQAWHAGNAVSAWANASSIGIELHHSVGDAPYPHEQIQALTWLCQHLMAEWDIPATRIETHRAIALPKGRKVDPHDWADAAFYAWRSALGVTYYRARYAQAIFESPHPAGKVALDGKAVLTAGELVPIDEVRSDGWAHLLSGVGFVPLGILEKASG